MTTQKELNRAYARYRVLPKRQKRFSDYYSNEFFGHNVTEMYIFMKQKLRISGGLPEEGQRPSEAYVISEPDLYTRTRCSRTSLHSR